MPPRRQHFSVLMILGLSAFLAITFVLTFRRQAEGTRHPDYVPSYEEPIGAIDEGVLHGTASAPKLENATLKYTLRSPSFDNS
jgi:FAD-linked sulfhydryl oxidase